jgi:hypothetical protein
MTRLVLLVLLAALVLPAGASARVRGASVTLTDCETSVSQTERAAGFEGRMKAGRVGQRLQMRFSLQRQDASTGRWTRVEVPGWAQWLTADPDTTHYAYEKRVESLEAPAAYRAVVRFRWTSALGRVVRTARVSSAVCRQPDLRPNLTPLTIHLRNGRYVVPVRNAGRSAAGPFAVVLTVNGEPQPAELVEGLGPSERTEVVLSGPRCERGTEITVSVDPDERVDERDELDNLASVPCSVASR